MGAPPWTVAHLVTSPIARQRLAAALDVEGLRDRPRTFADLRARGVGRRTAAFVYDLSPWDDSAPGMLRRLRRDSPDLPILLYAPACAGIGRLLIESAEFVPIWLELQLEGPTEGNRLARVLREVVSSHRQAQVLRRVRLVLRDLPDEVVRFCRTAIRVLGAADPGRRFNVESVAAAMGVSRRYLERIFKGKRLMPPRELLDWITLLSATAVAVERQAPLYAAGPMLGVERARLRRVRERLWHQGLDFDIEDPPGTAFNNVMSGFWMRCAELRLGGRFRPLTRAQLRPEALRTPTPTPRYGPRWEVIIADGEPVQPRAQRVPRVRRPTGS